MVFVGLGGGRHYYIKAESNIGKYYNNHFQSHITYYYKNPSISVVAVKSIYIEHRLILEISHG